MIRKKVIYGAQERAVSPVIGVILMVAITVILAAVIGVFVLGLGDELGDPAPNNDIDIEGPVDLATTEGNNLGDIAVAHVGGDAVEYDDLDVIIRDGDGNNLLNGIDRANFGDAVNNGGEFSVGASPTLDGIDVEDTSPTEPGILNDDLPDEGGEIEIVLIHSPSDSTMASETIDVIDSST